MPYERIEVTPVSPVIGAEIAGVDLSQPLGNKVFQEIHDALMAHQVIFFRDQELTWDQQKAFGRLFGDLHIHPAAPAPEGHPEIFEVHADENSHRIVGPDWHSDVSCDEAPPMGSVLHLHEVPEPGGDTLFASMYAAYDALSDEMKTFLGGLSAWHESEKVHRAVFEHRSDQLRDGADTYPKALQPIIRTHPVTGRKGIYVNTAFTTRIEGLNRNESDAILDMLYAHIDTPEFHCRFHWQKNSVAFWDNRCTQHQALWDYYPQTRSGSRVTICGDKVV